MLSCVRVLCESVYYLASTAIDLIEDFDELASDVRSVAVQHGGIAGDDLARVVDDLKSGVILWVDETCACMRMRTRTRVRACEFELLLFKHAFACV